MAKSRYQIHVDPSVDLLPIMNIVMMLIPFLLITAEFMQFSVISNINQPHVGAGGGQGDEEQFNLTVFITPDGYYIASAQGLISGGAVPGQGAAPILPKQPNGDYPYVELTRMMAEIKDRQPTETKVTLNIHPDVIYEIVTHTMDAVREPPDHSRMLFYDVALAMGIR